MYTLKEVIMEPIGSGTSKYKTFCAATVVNKLRKRRSASKKARQARRKSKGWGTAHKDLHAESLGRNIAQRDKDIVRKFKLKDYTPGGLISPQTNGEGGEVIVPLDKLQESFSHEVISSMKKPISLLLLMMFLLEACDVPQPNSGISAGIKSIEIGEPAIYDRYSLQIVLIDSCEYIAYSVGANFGLLTHKGNCKNPFHNQSQTAK